VVYEKCENLATDVVYSRDRGPRNQSWWAISRFQERGKSWCQRTHFILGFPLF